MGSDGGILQCPKPGGVVAVCAGHLFDSKSGKMLTEQVVILSGERITQVGSQAQVTIPTGATIVDLSRFTVLPGLIDAQTLAADTLFRAASTLTRTCLTIAGGMAPQKPRC